MTDFLKSHWSTTRDQRNDSRILSNLRMRNTTAVSLLADVNTLLAGLPRVLFITHVNAIKPDGYSLPARADFISLVEQTVRTAGGQFYNPTEAMLEMGQQVSIEDQSSSLAHFTEAFSRRVFADWLWLIGPELTVTKKSNKPTMLGKPAAHSHVGADVTTAGRLQATTTPQTQHTRQ